MINEVKALGHYPKDSKSDVRERNLAKRLKYAIKRGVLQPAELLELDDFRKQSVHPLDEARSSQLLEEAEQPPEPMEGFVREFFWGPILEVVIVFFLTTFFRGPILLCICRCICICTCICICICMYVFMYMYVGDLFCYAYQYVYVHV